VKPGQITDDTELALALARSLSTKGVFERRDVFASYQQWARSHPIDMGCATSNALLGNSPNDRTEANGALMRVSPLGIFCAHFPVLLTVELARLDASLTHPHKICQDSSAIFAATIARCIRLPNRPAKEVFDFALTLARIIGAKECVEDLEDVAKGKLRSSYAGHVRVAFSLAFFHLLKTPTLEAAVVNTVMHGEDADTNGCIVGALMGAFHGIDAIPNQWVQTVANAKVSRPAAYHATDLEVLAVELLS
jgi:ADP-ribosylglycohydrolase